MPAKKASKSVGVAKSMSTSTVTTSSPKSSACCRCSTQTWTMILLIVNTVLLLFLSFFGVRQAVMQVEMQRVGGKENYQLLQQLYKLESFKEQNKFQIEQMLQALQSNPAQNQQPMVMPESTQQVQEAN